MIVYRLIEDLMIQEIQGNENLSEKRPFIQIDTILDVIVQNTQKKISEKLPL